MRTFSLEEKDAIHSKLIVNVYCFLRVFLDNREASNLKTFSHPLCATMVGSVSDTVMCTISSPTNLKYLRLLLQLIF